MKNLILILFISIISGFVYGQQKKDTTWELSQTLDMSVNDFDTYIIRIKGTDILKFKPKDSSFISRVVRDTFITYNNGILTINGSSFSFSTQLGQIDIESNEHKNLILRITKNLINNSADSHILNYVNIYYDAVSLFNNLHNESEVKKILSKYHVTTLNNFLASVGIRETGGQVANIGTNFPSSGILGLDVTTLADGLAKFLVSRVKKELMISFFNNFSDKIRDTSLRDVQVLFKNTYQVLDVIGEKIYDFQPYLASIKQNMEYDFHNLPSSLQSLIQANNSQLTTLLNKERNLRFIAGSTIDLGIAIKEDRHMGKALSGMDFTAYAEHADTSLIGAFKTLRLFSESLRDTFTNDRMPYWIDKSKINRLVTTPDLLLCFVGLLMEIAKKENIKVKDKVTLYSYLNDTIGPSKVNKFTSFIQALQKNVSQINQIQHDFQISTEDDEKNLHIFNYFEAAYELMNTSKILLSIFNTNEKPGQIDTFFEIAFNINGIVKNASIKKYSMASMHLSKLMDYFTTGSSKTIETINFIVDKSLFIGQLAEAKTSDEVAEVIESFAAPIGSWRDKRTTNFNVALDSYVGPAAFITNDNQRLAVSTPVGISFTFPILKYPVSFLLSAIDIGPATAFRFKNDTSEVSKITLGEIVSPGIFTSINFGKSFPLTFNLGYQQYPLLKKVSNQSNDYNEVRKGGLSVSFNMNIPILTLYNRRQEER